MSSYQNVFRSPMNNSTSKTLHSFPKAERFEPTRTSPCRRSFYNFRSSSLQNRTTSFGYGNKLDFINREGVPAPGSYDRNSDFLNNKQRGRGFSFGNQDKLSVWDEAVPGPGKYERVYNNYSKINYSMRSKYEDPLERHKNPLGPGQYQELPMMNATGNYFNSTNKNSGCSRIGRASRFEDSRTESPGPGKYADKLAINKTGSYFNSKMPSNYVKSFKGTERPPINEPSETPGPGKYGRFSEFAPIHKYA